MAFAQAVVGLHSMGVRPTHMPVVKSPPLDFRPVIFLTIQQNPSQGISSSFCERRGGCTAKRMAGKVRAEVQASEDGTAAADVTVFKHVLLPITDRNPFLSEGTRQAWNEYESDQTLGMVDAKLEGTYPQQQVLKVITVALLCTQRSANLRPPMSQVMSMLTSDSEIVVKPTRPAFTGGSGSGRLTASAMTSNFWKESLNMAAAMTTALAKKYGADITVVVIDENSKEAIVDHDARLSSIRWHLAQGGFEEFGLMERLGEGKKPTAVIGEVADDLNLDLVVITMESIHSKHVDGNLLAEFVPCPVLLLPL